MKFGHWFGLGLIALLIGVDFGIAQAARPPGGSYRDSCRSVSVSRDILRANCEKGRGRVWTRLSNYSNCVGDISNHGGQLICLRKRDLPRGDWNESCINPHLARPGVFAAVCKSLRGGWITSEIALDKCSEGFTNARGQLGCKKPKVIELPSPSAPLATVAPQPMPADEQPEEPDGPSLPPPTGAYLETCREIAFDGRYLSGECRNDRGRWQDTSIDTKSCASDQVVGNDDGELVCTRRPGREPPAGLYQQSCKDVTFDGRFVRADCKDAKGTWMRALLDVRECEEGDEIVNEDAEIICRAPAPLAPPAPAKLVSGAPTESAIAPTPSATTAVPLRQTMPMTTPVAPRSPPPPPAAVPSAATSIPAPPPGSPAESSAASAAAPQPPLPAVQATALITLYDGRGFEGANKTLTGDAPDLAPLGWTKIASSVQVIGTWEVCDEPNYRGHCQRIEEDEPSLEDLDLNDHISSVRQVRQPTAPAEP